MPPRISWRNLLPGLAAFAATVLFAVGVLVFAGVGRIRGEKIRLYVLTNQARSVMRGTEVWLAGQKIGLVDAVEFLPPGADTVARVVLVVSVRKRDAGQIRRDSDVQIRAGANLIGPIVVYFTAGTPGGSPVRSGDTLRGLAQSDLEVAGTKVNAATDELRPLLADARVVMGRVRDPQGTLGAFLAERNGSGGEMAKLRAHVGRFRQRFFNGNGEHPSAPNVMARTQAAMARVDSIRTLLRSPSTSLGRFRRDASLATAVAGVRDEISELRATLARADGTLGRYANDSTLTQSMAAAQREMALLFNDIRRRPMHYIHF